MPTPKSRIITYNRQASPTQGRLILHQLPGAPVVVLIQHGGWQEVDYSDTWMIPWVDALTGAGFTVVGLNWRFAPSYHYPIALEDIDLAIRVAHAALAADYKRSWVPLNVLGFSSGAHLAALWALNRPSYSRQNYDARLNVRTVISMAGAYNLNDGTLNDAALGFLHGFLDTPAWVHAASPIVYAPLASRQNTRYILIHGEADSLLPFDTQAVAMYDAMVVGKAKSVKLRSYPGVGHDIGQYATPNWNARLQEVIADLRATA